jgi:hypothetical protein
MYVLDTNVFISAKNAHYGMDFVPGFWSWLHAAHAAGVVCSVDAVRDELVDGADELSDWTNRSPRYTQAAAGTFLASADYFLIGQAKALGFTVVTHERPAPEARKRILIPDACDAVDAEYCLPWKMLRDQQVRLVL